ncbi:MAG: DUF294 nucleotidyltransferase-like domain-containing protein [Candidatus Lutibacillus vidarii]|jgi:CBS domain-containing protein|nr:DUF294 nucleotidyltransferase-like domain-containing protein [Dermatophilaceae bacterium]HRB99812.1 DUF294 nucleotidyltransferase-like domain-containing protein [Dermatophilaceae bacterium]
MDTELTEVRDFLAATPPFDLLPAGVLDGIPARLLVRYYRRGATILAPGDRSDALYVIRSGAVDLVDGQGALLDRRDVGAGFGMSTLLRGGDFKNYITAIEDTLVLYLPGDVFRELVAQEPEFEAFYRSRIRARMRAAVESVQATDRGVPILKTPVRELVRRPPLSAPPTTSIRAAAQLMSQGGVSSLLVMDEGRLVGIVTDRDLRNRVIAPGVDLALPVSTVMTSDPVTAPADALAFELFFDMAARNIHHVPVMRGAEVLGVLSSSDLARLQHDNPVLLVGEIRRQSTIDGLVASSQRIPELVTQLVSEDVTAHQIGRVVTTVGDAIERRQIEMVEAEMGPPPVPYCWVVLGSQARHEQGLSSDQDNAIILSDAYRPERPEHAEYFAELARRMVAGLAACGYPVCKGDVMATNAAWRVPLGVWRRTFSEWMTTPHADALVNASIFFDMRALHGDSGLFEALREDVLAQAPSSERMLAHLTKSAVEHQPPLGFFRGFVLEKAGEHAAKLDLKGGGVAALVELARVYALENGLPDVNTRGRLEATAAIGRLSERRAAELTDALEFVSYVRLRHQVRQHRAGVAPDNFVSPSELTDEERRHLKDVFQIIRRAQATLAARRPLHYVS